MDLKTVKPRGIPFHLLCLYALLLMVLTGCGTLSSGKKWGESATFSPGWERVGRAAVNSAISPGTWGPAVGAALFQIDGWDRKLSDWASDKTPIFGSQHKAKNYSDYLLYASGTAYGVTALAAPSGDAAGEWATNKLKGFIVGGVAIGAAEGTDLLFNAAISRQRPNGKDTRSFPSGHSMIAASFATLAARNIDAMNLPSAIGTAADFGLGLLAAGTAWSRLEAKDHYPSDVLAGLALGHFISAFVNDAFLGTKRPADFTPEADVLKNGVMLKVSWKY